MAFKDRCDKCRERHRIAVVCKKCDDLICDGCAYTEEKQKQTCMLCLLREEEE